jgi:hypothetical protein
MPAVTRNRAVELFWRVHPAIYRLTGGRLLGRIAGVPVLLLTTRGRRTGEERTKPLLYLADGDASFAEYERRTTRRIPVVVLEPVGRA